MTALAIAVAIANVGGHPDVNGYQFEVDARLRDTGSASTPHVDSVEFVEFRILEQAAGATGWRTGDEILFPLTMRPQKSP